MSVVVGFVTGGGVDILLVMLAWSPCSFGYPCVVETLAVTVSVSWRAVLMISGKSMINS